MKPVILGLTGSIGMGKSTVAAMFRRLGCPVFDADAAVRALQGPGGRALAAIEAMFAGTTGASGVDRAKLGAAVFGNADALGQLERLIHPMVGVAQSTFMRRHRASEIVVLDVPLLFERGGWRQCDATAVVSAPARVQRVRVLRRPGMTTGKFAAIFAGQMPDAEKRCRADYVIPTGRGRRATWHAVRSTIANLRRPLPCRKLRARR